MFAAPGDPGQVIFTLLTLAFFFVFPALKAYLEAQAAKKQQQKERARRTGVQRGQNPPDTYERPDAERDFSRTPDGEPRPAQRPGQSKQRRVRRRSDEETRQPAPLALSATSDTPEAANTSLTRLDSSLPSTSVFSTSQPLATSVGLSGLNAEALPSDHHDRIYDEASAGTVGGRTVSPFATELLRLFSSPQSMQQAILIAEIMRRPDFEPRDSQTR